MKVWVELWPLGGVKSVSVQPNASASFTVGCHLAGAEGKVLVDRGWLREGLHHGNDFGEWCGWPGCECAPWSDDPADHSGTCPLAEGGD
jgi:hypothetical protein